MASSPLTDKLLARIGKTRADFRASSRVGQLFRKTGARDTPELRRVLSLPRRDLATGLGEEFGTPEEMAELLTEEFKRPGGTMKLRPIQALALQEAHDFKGLLGPIRVGGGKCTVYETEVWADQRRCMVGALVGSTFNVLTMLEDGTLGYRAASAFASGRKECVRLTLADGTSTALSTDHPVLTTRGWIEASKIEHSDLVRRLSFGHLAWVNAQSIVPIGVRDVFDLSVPETGCFVGDNIVLHNTLVTFLAPKVLEAKRPLLLIPAKLRHKTEREWFVLQEHWVLPQIRVESYTKIGLVQHAEFLNNYKPDLIIADECQRLKNSKAACVRRVRRYMKENPETIFLALSGTITRKSLLEYWHILRWTHGDRHMPLPASWEELIQWAGSLDVQTEKEGQKQKYAPGALLELCTPEEKRDFETKGLSEDGLSVVRRAFQRRLTQTPGVVSTVDAQVSCSLLIRQVELDLSDRVELFKTMRETWETPDGHPFDEPVDMWRHARELACDMYYVWDPRPPKEWLIARKRWSKFVRGVLKNSKHLDSKLQVVHAVQAGEISALVDDVGGKVDAWAAWQAVEHTFKPNTVPRWIGDTTLQYATKWGVENKGIIWVEHLAFGEKLAEISGMPYYGRKGMTKDGVPIESEQGNRSIIASIAANGEGRNLQCFAQNLIVSCPPSGATLEQLLGRTHRDGQEADEVEVEILISCIEQWKGFQTALKDARYIQDSTGASQKLLYADLDVMDANEVIGKHDGGLWK